jgi:glycosidase
MSDPLWYKDSIVYQLHVKAFRDSNNDGFGDFPGLMQKLEYLESLGINALWLLPFYPSPLRDDGYDIADYENIHPQYGTLDDFRRFLDEAHRRNIRVITELVINHTSDQHPWFQAARRRDPKYLTIRTATVRRGSSSPTRRSRTGPGIRWPSSSTGTASSATSPISTSTTPPWSTRSCAS